MAGYTRQAAANIVTGSVIDADDFNDEYNQVQSAFNSSTGHTHDGSAGEGAPITTIGPSQDIVATASVLRPKTTNAVDLGTTALQYKDAYFDAARDFPPNNRLANYARFFASRGHSNVIATAPPAVFIK